MSKQISKKIEKDESISRKTKNSRFNEVLVCFMENVRMSTEVHSEIVETSLIALIATNNPRKQKIQVDG